MYYDAEQFETFIPLHSRPFSPRRSESLISMNAVLQEIADRWFGKLETTNLSFISSNIILKGVEG